MPLRNDATIYPISNQTLKSVFFVNDRDAVAFVAALH